MNAVRVAVNGSVLNFADSVLLKSPLARPSGASSIASERLSLCPLRPTMIARTRPCRAAAGPPLARHGLPRRPDGRGGGVLVRGGLPPLPPGAPATPSTQLSTHLTHSSAETARARLQEPSDE